MGRKKLIYNLYIHIIDIYIYISILIKEIPLFLFLWILFYLPLVFTEPFGHFHLKSVWGNLLQEETDMESVEVDAVAVAALKSSFRPEMEAGRTTPHHHQLQASNDEVGGGDETFVDEFLNFSNEDVHGFVSENEEGEKEEEKNSSCGSVLSMEETHLGKTSDSNSNYDFGSVLSREETHLGKTSDSTSNYDFEPELCVPVRGKKMEFCFVFTAHFVFFLLILRDSDFWDFCFLFGQKDG